MFFVNPQPAASSDPTITINTQVELGFFYSPVLGLLNRFYLEQTVTMTTGIPDYFTAAIKFKLKRKSRLVSAGRTEETGALANRIGKDILRHTKTRLAISKIGAKVNAKDMWVAVR